MIIKKIVVKRFRAIKEQKNPLDFAPGLNIIKGSDNEAGKSSLRMAIIKALFQDPNTTRKDIQALTSWGTDEPWEVTLDFDADEGHYRITKSFKDKTCELTAIGSNGFVARNKDTIAEKIAELTGCPSEAFFESTACIGQEEFVRIVPESARNTKDNPLGTITKRLQAKLSGTEGADIPALLAQLYAKTHRKEAGGPYSHLQNITERIADLRSQRLGQETKVNDIMEKRKTLAQAKLELEQIDRDFPAKRELLDKNKMILALQKEIAREKTQYESFQKAKELKAEIERLEKELEPLSHFENAEEKITEIDDIKVQIESLSRQTTASRNDLDKLEKQKPSLLTLVAGAVLIAGGLISLLANDLLWVVSVAGLFVAAYWLVSRRTWKKQRKAYVQRLSELEKEFGGYRDREQQLLKEYGCTNSEEFHGRLADFRKKTGAKRDAINGLEVLTAEKEWHEFVAENVDMDIQMTAKIKELQQLEPFKLDPLPLQELEQAVNKLEKLKSTLEQETGALEKFFQYTNTDRNQFTDIEEELTGLEQQKEFWERKKKIYEVTHDTLEQAHKQTLSKAIDLLEAEINHSINLITGGRYKRVQIKEEESDLSIQTFSTEMNDWVSVDELSRATQDQFYICARLALAKLITEGKKPTILLDDPFVNFHAKRLKKTMHLLQELAKEGYQILLFTCSDAYDYLGKVLSVD